jgi:hypothetical protein
MTKGIPAWALRAATGDDRDLAHAAQGHGRMHIRWPPTEALRAWAQQHGWATPFFRFEETFLETMLVSHEHFALAVAESGIQIHLPKQEHTLSAERLRELDALYQGRSEAGYPNGWGSLVEELREIRRAVEAGVAVQVEGEQPMLTWQDFYQWAHGRYHMLEDGADKWIGDDA